MSPEQSATLALHRELPARLLSEQVAHVLNFAAHDIPILVAAKLLKPLGSPPPGGVRYFARVEILRLAADPAWLAKATNAIYGHWRERNLRKGKGSNLSGPRTGQGYSRNGAAGVPAAGYVRMKEDSPSQQQRQEV